MMEEETKSSDLAITDTAIKLPRWFAVVLAGGIAAVVAGGVEMRAGIYRNGSDIQEIKKISIATQESMQVHYRASGHSGAETSIERLELEVRSMRERLRKLENGGG